MEIKQILTFASFLLTVADVVSDIVLAADYCESDNRWYCGLTWTFVALLILTFFIVVPSSASSNNTDRSSIWTFWKTTETTFESGPQLVLQLYIMASSAQDPTPSSGTTCFNGCKILFLAIISQVIKYAVISRVTQETYTSFSFTVTDFSLFTNS